MLESQFYNRIILIVVFGVLFILSMLKKGKKNSIENPSEKHIWLKVLAGLFVALALFSLVTGIQALKVVEFPTEMMKQPLTAHTIFRSSSPIWGYPTPAQKMALTNITNVFIYLAFAAYFLVFRKSGTKWWQKLLKVIGIIAMWMFFASATELQYFDIYELFAPIGFLILAILGLIERRKETIEEPAKDVQAQPEKIQEEDHSRFMPPELRSTTTSDTIIETTDVEL